jgi:hypothetical protein
MSDVPQVQVFYPYETKPITRYARQIKEAKEVEKVLDIPNTYLLVLGFATPIPFKAYEEPKVGDWVVRLTKEDTYHCTDAVFRERNIVPE